MNFFTAPVTTEQKKYGCYLARGVDLGKRGDGSDGTPKNQMLGKIGETCFADAMRIPRPKNFAFVDSHDNGVDFEIQGVKIDVKTTLRNVRYRFKYEFEIPVSQVESEVLNPDIYLFCNIANLSKKEQYFEVIGWLQASNARAGYKGIYRLNAGQTNRITARGDLLKVPTSALNLFVNPVVFRADLIGL